MSVSTSNIDIKESKLRRSGNLLSILLLDRTTQKNIIWATDSYQNRGKEFAPDKRVELDLVTGIYGSLIQPRAAKSLAEQRQRTKDKAEVFTPLETVKLMNNAVDTYALDKKNWQEYVRELKLEITCGEAPFIVSRYSPTSHTGKLLIIGNRVGFLDKKLKVVSKNCDTKKDWLFWAKEAFKASYGYEWQGDNVLLARENLLYTFLDYYEAQFEKKPTLKMKEEFAEIISWNIFQMDGLRYVVPMSCFHENEVVPGQPSFFEDEPIKVEEYECEGCKYNRVHKHNGLYIKIMDWSENKVVRFVDLVTKEEKS